MAQDFIPYSRQEISEADIAAVTELLRSDYLTQGPKGPEFETAFAARHQTAHAIAVSNATAGLHLACLALGVGAGSRVWTSPNSFVSSANCALFCGAEVDFVDIDPVTRNMSLEALTAKLERADRLGGVPAEVIQVEYAVTTAEGGMVVTQNDALAERLRLLRSHGVTRDEALMERRAPGTRSSGAHTLGAWYYEVVDLGWNYRLTDMQAALGLSQLERMDDWREARQRRADRYDALLADGPFKRPARFNDRVSAWHLYAVELTEAAKASRAHVFTGLRDAGIGVNVHYIPIHTQPFYEKRGFTRGDFPNAVAYYDAALSLPLFPAMTPDQQSRVADTLLKLAA